MPVDVRKSVTVSFALHGFPGLRLDLYATNLTKISTLQTTTEITSMMEDLTDRIGQLPPLKRALLAIEELQARVDSLEKQQHEPIAIIGIGCRFPGANNPQEFWKILHDGIDAIREVPPDRWDNRIFYDPTPGTPGKTITRFGGFLGQVDQFDPLFFGISPREAARMDPQQRLLLEVAWEALENAGQAVDRLAGSKTGVFVGVSNNDYSIFQYTDLTQVDAYGGTGNAFSIAANRLSYTFDLHGPSVAIDTACSSSLVAVHLAVRSLRQQETDLALAGGVNLILSPELTITFSQAGMMSADGRCKSFDASADGYGRGEGCGIVVLKRLADAVRDGDEILAVIYGTAVNQDGRSNGLTAPNGIAQQAVIREAFQDAGISPEEVDFIEAHGTGTILGDPIEMRALGSVLRSRSAENLCMVGSVKTNIGHLESASGVASLIKVILSLNYSAIPANLHFTKLNPYIDPADAPVAIPTRLTPWERLPGKNRFAGVNSFGFGGTNAHIILGDVPAGLTRSEARNEENAQFSLANRLVEIPQVLTLSAKSEAALVQLAKNYLSLLISWQGKLDPTTQKQILENICQTTNSKRSHLDYRLACGAHSLDDLVAKLAFFLAQNTPQPRPIQLGIDTVIRQDESTSPARQHKLSIGLRYASGKPTTAFLFPGQGFEYPEMGLLLYETQPVFRSAWDRCLETLADSSLSEFQLTKIDPTAHPQLATFCVEYALAQMWTALGVHPDIVLGFGVGEYVAACIAGVVSLQDAMKLVVVREKLLQDSARARQQAVAFTSPEKIANLFSDLQVEMIGSDGQDGLIFSADSANFELALTRLADEGILTYNQNRDQASRSILSEPALAEFVALAGQVDYRPARIRMISSLTGQVINGPIDAGYWQQQIYSAGELAHSLQTLVSSAVHIFVEVGPESQVLALGQSFFPEKRSAWVASIKEGRSDWDVVTEGTATLYAAGINLNWPIMANLPRVSTLSLPFQLPTYPFQREHFWFDGIDSEDRMRLKGSDDWDPCGDSTLPGSDDSSATTLISQSADRFGKGRGELLLGKLVSARQEPLLVYQFANTWTYQDLSELGLISSFKSPEYNDTNDPLEPMPSGDVAGDAGFREMAIAALGISGLVTGLDHPDTGTRMDRGKVENSATSEEIGFETISYPQAEAYPAWPPLDLTPEWRVDVSALLTLLGNTRVRFELFMQSPVVWQPVYGVIITLPGWLVMEQKNSLLLTGAASEQQADQGKKEQAENVNYAEIILETSPEERLALLEKILREQLGRVLRMDSARISRELGNERPIQYLGLDSIMAIELMNLIERGLRVHLPITSFLKGPTITSLSTQLLGLIEANQSEFTNPITPLFSLKTHALENIETTADVFTGVSGERIYPLSFGQRAMWFQHQMAPESVFNPVNVVKIHSTIDLVRLQWTLHILAKRHPSLRTTFVTKDGEPYQRILSVDSDLNGEGESQADILIRQIDASAWDDRTLHDRLITEADSNFDLEHGPLFRVVLYSKADDEHVLLLTAHHIITDLWSMAILINELAFIYSHLLAVGNFPLDSALIEQIEDDLPRPSLDYLDFVAWQKDLLDGPRGEQLWHYWSDKLKGELPILDLPTDRPRPAIQTYHGASCSIILDQDLTQRLQDLSEKAGVTLYVTLLAAFKILLYRYSGQEDLIIGAPTTGRDHPGLDEIIGYFVNPIALRTQLNADMKFTDYIQQVSQTVIDALDNQDYPFALLVEKLKPERDPSRLPISQVMFILQRAQHSRRDGLLDQDKLSQFAVSMDGLQMDLAGLRVESLSLEIQKAQMDLTMIMAEVPGGLGASLTYNTDLYNSETIERLLRHYKTLLEGIVADPTHALGFLPLLTQKEYNQVVFGFNQSEEIIWPELSLETDDIAESRAYGLCVHRLFEARVQLNPQAAAVVFVDGKQQMSLTYGELNRKANRLAHYLQALGVGPDSIVGVCVERSLDMIIGLLAVLKAGGAYLPMDPASPTDRLAFMIQDAKIDILLSQSHLVEKLPTIAAQLIYLDRNWEAMVREILARIGNDPPQGSLESNPESSVRADNLAYVIYTSGSTGRSKGVLLEHLGLSNLVWAQIRAFRITPESRELQFASFSFDASLSEIFTALLGGASLYLTRREILLSISDLIKFFQEHEISVVTLPPSVLAMMPSLTQEELPKLKTIVSAGEALTPEIALRWAPGRIFLNAYGPTESTIGPTYFEMDGTKADQAGLSELLKTRTGLGRREELIVNTVPIGRPISNIHIYLLDKRGQPVPIGMAGEIFIGGFGVARGYLNRPELTADKFVVNPINGLDSETGMARARLYRTGDLARWLPDGNIEFLGRVDFQVKLRGFRIELEEIETVLNQHELVQQTAVIVSGNQAENRRLVAYVVAEAGMPLSFNDLRDYLRLYLPDYMIPSIFVIMDAFPLTTSGKIDRKALPDVNGTRPDLEAAYVPPQTEVERMIARIWQEILNVEKVGLNDNFFDLGGHSLLLFKAHTRLQDTFNRTFSMVELFRYPTVSALSEFLGRETQEQPSLQRSQDRADLQKDALKRQVDRMRELANTRAAAAKQAAMKRVNQPGNQPGLTPPGKPGDPK